MLLTVLAPEVVTGKALADFLSASHNKTKMKDAARRDGIKWTLTHAFLADMGGFAIVFPPLLQPNSAGPQADGDASAPSVNQATRKLREILKARSEIEKWRMSTFAGSTAGQLKNIGRISPHYRAISGSWTRISCTSLGGVESSNHYQMRPKTT
jgi:hypothetical protein